MIYNATLTRIDTPLSADAAGKLTYSAGAALVCRCFLDTRAQTEKYPTTAAGGGQVQKLNVAKLQVLTRDLQPALFQAGYDAGTEIDADAKLTVQIDDGPTLLYRVRDVTLQPRGSMTVLLITMEED